MQLLAGFKKELIYSVRTFRLVGMILAFGFFAIADPLMTYFLPKLMEKSGVDISAMSALLVADISSSLARFIGDILELGILIVLLCLMGTAGGEQKKKSTVIPMCSGLSVTNYLLPKFILYPIIGFVLAFGATFLAYGVSSVLFHATLPLETIAASAMSLGLYTAFMIALLLFMGIATGKAGIGAAVIFVLSLLLPLLLDAMKLNRYNPLALPKMAAQITTGFTTEMLTTCLVTLALIPVFFLLTNIFLLRKKK